MRHAVLFMCVSLLYGVNGDESKFVKIVGQMKFVTIRRNYDPWIIESTVEAPTLKMCAAKCTLQSTNSLSLYFIHEDRKCHCNNRLDLSTDYDVTKPEAVYGYFEQLDEVFENTDTGMLTTTTMFKKDCTELYNAGYHDDGIYKIQPDGLALMDAWCHMSDGGWTVIQRRMNGPDEDFYRDITDYVNGFGDVTGEFWIGLDRLHTLTSSPSELQVYLEAFDGTTPASIYGQYSTFSVEGSSLNYAAHIGGFTGSCAGDPIFGTNVTFSTIAADYSPDVEDARMENHHGSWWYLSSRLVNLNGYTYLGDQVTWESSWESCWGNYYQPKKMELRIKRKITQ